MQKQQQHKPAAPAHHTNQLHEDKDEPATPSPVPPAPVHHATHDDLVHRTQPAPLAARKKASSAMKVGDTVKHTSGAKCIVNEIKDDGTISVTTDDSKHAFDCDIGDLKVLK